MLGTSLQPLLECIKTMAFVEVEVNVTTPLARIPDCKITKVDDLLPWNMGSHHHMKDAA